MLYGLSQNVSFLTMLIMKIRYILPKRKNNAPNFLYVAKYMKIYQKFIKKVGIMLGEKLAIFALCPKLDLANVTFILTSASKFLWLVIHFDKLFWFWYETEIVTENSYSGIWPFLEIRTLKWILYKFVSKLHIFCMAKLAFQIKPIFTSICQFQGFIFVSLRKSLWSSVGHAHLT